MAEAIGLCLHRRRCRRLCPARMGSIASPDGRSSASSTIILIFFILFSSAAAWKKEEFRSCNQIPFCKRARGRAPHSVSPFSVADISLSDGAVSARLFPSPVIRQVTEDDSSSANVDDTAEPRALLLRLSVYNGGILRLEIDEDPSSAPTPKRRFRVPDVLLSDLEDRRLWLSRLSSPSGADFTSFYLADGFEGVLRHNPFEIVVRRAGSGGEPVLSLNSHGLFDFEQLRAKKEGENWEENFRSHTDSRPHGPQSISFDVTFHGANFVYGIPEHASPSLSLRATRGPGVDESEPYRLFNLDVFEYLHDSPFGIYGSIPYMLSHGPSSSSGFFWLNAAEMQIDVLAPGWDDPAAPKSGRVDTFWMSEAGIVDAFFFVGPAPKDVLKQYASVTGTQAMPQEFSLAYHQCRWNYRDEEDVEGVDAGFDEHDIPYDVLWLDIEHTDGKRYFTWDPVLFPNPEQMQKKLAAKGRRMVTIVDPHIKRDGSYFLHNEATEKGYYVKDESGKDYEGWCWPGSSSYPDMLNPQIRDWWGDKFSFKNYVGSTPSLYTWNDMNEPSVFNGPELTMPRDLLHYGDVEHRELHNAYGYYFHMATANGLLKRGEGKDRPFVLSRAFFAGTQRHGAIWTGDNVAEWAHLRVSVPMILNIGLTGISFSGADVGGFFGNPEPDLLVRWYQLAAYYPFFRGHAHHDTKRREPWLFGEQKTALLREAIRIRYSLLPYYYTLFREASVSGIPILRPLWLEFPADKETFDNSEAFMAGPSLLVHGIYEKNKKSVTVYLPSGASWFNLKNGVKFDGGASYKLDTSEDSIPTFQRAGTIIPRKERFRRSSTQMVNDPYTLVIALNGSLAAEGHLYIDDGKSYEFEKGAYIHRRFIFADGKLTSINLRPSDAGNGKFSTDCTVERIILLGHPSGAKKAVVEPGNRVTNIELGPLALRSGSKLVALTVRKPDVRIADDWSIRIL